MAVVALVVNAGRPRAVKLALQAAAWLAERDHQLRMTTEEAAAVGLPEHGWDEEKLARGAQLMVSLGGDGTMLRAVRLAAPEAVPVLGVNLGHLGYLADVEPDALPEALARFMAGDHTVEERMMLSVSVERGGDADDVARASPSLGGDPAPAGTVLLALNEAVVEKPSPGQVVHVAVTVDGQFFTTYAADGLILATPTGSTAYSFSAGGPLIAPTHRALLMTPVSPHTPFQRSHVFNPDQTVRLQVTSGRSAMLAVDGASVGLLGPHDVVRATAAGTAARFVTFGPRDFYAVLKTKFRLADR